MHVYETQLKRAWSQRCARSPSLATAQFLEHWLVTLANQGAIIEFVIEEDATSYTVGFTDGNDWGLVDLEKP